MAFPILPFLLIAGALGGGVYVLTQGSDASDQPVVKDGVRYGKYCSTLEIVDMPTFAKKTEPKAKSLQTSLNPDMLARDALQKIAKMFFPGPGCLWATDGTFDCTFLLPGGQVDASWKDLLAASGDMTLGQAIQSGAWAALGGLNMQSAGSSAAALDFLLSPAQRTVQVIT